MIIEQRTRPQEPLDFILNKHMETCSNKPPTIDLFEERKWLLAVTSFEAIISIFIITYENNSFSISTPGLWNPEGSGEIIDKLIKLLELRS